MQYDVSLSVAYRFDNAASASRNIVRLMPADLGGEQRLVAGTLTVTPKPDEWVNRIDYFRNAMVEVAFHEAHREITFAVTSRVQRLERGRRLDMSPPVDKIGPEIAAYRRLDAGSPYHFVGPSRRVPLTAEMTEYGRETARGTQSVLEAVEAIGQAIYRDWTYRPGATTVETPTVEAFEARIGVCQDFSHIMIAALRGLGIPAGYVSGCLRTDPPPGEPRLAGADAMHAWVCAWCGPELGWVDYDPTNAVPAGLDHIVIGRGRDYSDVAPVRGAMRTSGQHSSRHSVDVVPVETERHAVAAGTEEGT
ncbi:transglutaminase family protein [Acuticoccus sp. I52.16.1]|uniref:transglutaminase family protein n=1 Tax=Acuticoccus sp. I52.16.1 TaxID=2928472 RepID=UPI001FD52347|nr:transglutaminase family protein [Acuticoccus sp. I52.16.1]UOM33206.1 transglutaminase family protein [Acuticoccus sp. I52.16.1]